MKYIVLKSAISVKGGITRFVHAMITAFLSLLLWCSDSTVGYARAR